ncbi:MAG: LapA family protein [Calothrix sp. MO_167.B12]|nr:LapA family protein [Calothrix sp. MO_167.B12]
MRIFTLLALLIATMAVIFALQNSAPVVVQFLGWRSQDSMALVLLLTFTFGVLFGLLVSLPTIIKMGKRNKHLTRKLKEHKDEIEELNYKLSEVNNQLHTVENMPEVHNIPKQEQLNPLPDSSIN